MTDGHPITNTYEGTGTKMALVETERRGAVTILTMNRPERLNAMGKDLLTELARAWCEFRDSPSQKIAILTGSGRAFCAGEDLKESAELGISGLHPDVPYDPYWNGGKGPATSIDKPIIAAVNGWAMGGGFIFTWMADLRVAARSAVFEISEARHWLLGAFQYGFTDTLPWSVATELSLGFRMSAQRAHEVGFVNRLTEDNEVLSVSLEMCDHLLSIPPASLRNTLEISRRLRPQIPQDAEVIATGLRSRGNPDDIAEARRAFAEKRKPVFTQL